MSRCEDYPCCGCGPGGCIDYSRTNECTDCGQSFHPDGGAEEVCYRCQAIHQIKMEEDYFDYEDDY